MNKTELVEKIATELDIPKKAAGEFVDAYHKTIADTLAQGDVVSLIGFGSFSVRDRSARTGRNPQTGEEMQIAASRAPVFKAGKALKDAVAK